MWFDSALGKEKIKFMFNNDLDIEDLEFESLHFYDASKVKLCFISKKIPEKVPDKWKKNQYNGILITLVFVGITQINMAGTRVGFKCTPIINNEENTITMIIEDEQKKLRLCLSAEVMVIDALEPYLDQRWK